MKKQFKKIRNKKLKKIKKRIKEFALEFVPQEIWNNFRRQYSGICYNVRFENLLILKKYLCNDYAISYIINRLKNKYNTEVSYIKEEESFSVKISNKSKIKKRLDKIKFAYNESEKIMKQKIISFFKKDIFESYRENIRKTKFSNEFIINNSDLKVSELEFKNQISFIRFFIEKKYKIKTFYFTENQIRLNI